MCATVRTTWSTDERQKPKIAFDAYFLLNFVLLDISFKIVKIKRGNDGWSVQSIVFVKTTILLW